jgi:hypothetical protein
MNDGGDETSCAACDAVDEAYGPILRHDDIDETAALLAAAGEEIRRLRCALSEADDAMCAVIRLRVALADARQDAYVRVGWVLGVLDGEPLD